jgi:hypothetical protein
VRALDTGGQGLLWDPGTIQYMLDKRSAEADGRWVQHLRYHRALVSKAAMRSSVGICCDFWAEQNQALLQSAVARLKVPGEPCIDGNLSWYPELAGTLRQNIESGLFSTLAGVTVSSCEHLFSTHCSCV